MKSILLSLGIMAAASGVQAFELSSPDLVEGTPIGDMFVFDGFGCTGGNVSPALTWSDAPEGTKSFALMVHDPDAPTGGAGFWHWIALDIPGSAEGLAQGAGAAGGDAMPEGAKMIANDYGIEGWGGPCPPEGDDAHRYNVTLYALPVEKLEIPAGASKAVTGFIVNATAIGKATLQGLYGR
ncbi:Phospholipid-binding protein [Rhodovulum sp. P5]|uniref:YbhB/YbcL family Raf kinase inhibitor-like protein n=1 Tax=Rhodovulum sp. P5 TaxID=1564506 RepID=UPI0009C359F0|nr:YbhB/YbcL family Raf kinase inhibitor-like protein [Rhodovulum sp. P5]ARE38312.1 Phospholipid-binding protein [Rhodovulum sp. P5]